MGENVRIIIDGPPEYAADALKTILENRDSLDRSKTGWGWGVVHRGRWEAFIRRTKTGYSASVTAALSPESER